MSSFTLPRLLLHKTIEPQWFPPSKHETESTLTLLEAAEEDYRRTQTEALQTMLGNPVVLGASRRPTRSRPSGEGNASTRQGSSRLWNRRPSDTTAGG